MITYGQLAEMAGAKQAARVVGNILKQLPINTNLPWHRVINHKGQLSFPEDTLRYQKQKDRLEAEGVILLSGKLDLKHYRWNGE